MIETNHCKHFALLLLGVLLVVFLRMVADLLLGVLLGVILAAMTHWVFEWFVRITKGRRKIAAGLAVLANILFVVVPLGLLAMLMVSDALKLANQAGEWFKPYQPQLQATFDRIAYGGKVDLFGYELEVGNLVDKLQQSIGSIAKFLVMLLQKTVGGLASGILLVFVALYTLYFTYLDGEKFWEWLKGILPLKSEQSDRLRQDFSATSSATIKTLGVIGLLQGAMGGLAFLICGIPGVLFWTILMAIASVIPLVGAQIILFPAAVILILMGELWYGIGLFLWSWIAIANIDNFLRPILIGKQTQLHEVIVFLSTVGGIAMFGFFGFLLGPVIAALLKVSFQIYAEAFPKKNAETLKG
jgi:predicted PurR-regulated permease PerM